MGTFVPRASAWTSCSAATPNRKLAEFRPRVRSVLLSVAAANGA
jgi:hypothetical protein